MSPVTFISHPDALGDRSLGYFAVHVLHEGKVIPLLLSDHEFDRAVKRAAKNGALVPPRLAPVHETTFPAKAAPAPWYKRVFSFLGGGR